MHKTEIGWTRRDGEGVKLDVFARRMGGKWLFFKRYRRYDQWEPVLDPPLEDWIELLDAVCRRADRHLLRPEEVGRVKQFIRERFPEAEV